jgi:hypothetical protein
MITWLLFFWVHSKTEHHGGDHVVEQSSSLHGGQETEVTEGGQGKDRLFKDIHPVTPFL